MKAEPKREPKGDEEASHKEMENWWWIQKRKRKLQWEIDRLTRATEDAESLDEWREKNVTELTKCSHLQEELNQLETYELKAQAESFGIHLLPTEEPNDDPQLWAKTRDGFNRFLTPRGLELAKKRIIEARFAYWKRWVDIITPVASTIISILALLIAALALYLQISSDSIIVVPLR